MDEKLVGQKGFDYWMNLFKNDPAAFERERAEAIEAAIAEAPEHLRPRLRQLQANIDEMRKTDDFRMMTVLRLHHMLWETFSELLALETDLATIVRDRLRPQGA